MKRSELNKIKESIATNKEKASDIDVLVTEIKKLPYGQLKKVLTEPVMEVLEKYGYTE